MSELDQLLRLACGLLAVLGFVGCYILGGLAGGPGLWVRRWLGGVGFAAAMNALAWWHGNWQVLMLGYLAALPAALTLPYGSEDVGERVFLRLLFGFAVSAASLFMLWPLTAFGIWGFQVLLGVATSVYWGVKNPTSSVSEQGFIGLALVCTVPFALVR